VRLTIRYFAAARAAAGRETAVVDVPDEITLGELEHILAADNPALRHVLDRSSYLWDEVAVCDRDRGLGATRTVDILPPFAGG
jgi:molybdopterin converting factor small subunit